MTIPQVLQKQNLDKINLVILKKKNINNNRNELHTPSKNKFTLLLSFLN
jgi:hypothetical protein